MILRPHLRVLKLYVSPGHNFFGHHDTHAGEHPTLEVPEVNIIAGSGIEGDRFFDYKKEYKGQVTFFDYAVYQSLCAELSVSDKSPAVFRRNVLTIGCNLNDLIGHEFEVQGIRFAGIEESRPCAWMNEAFGPRAESALRGRGGLRTRVLTSGLLHSES
ncbi:hypothetical protein BH09VER1_BH09VER1_41620 [soil metagenome]